VNNRVAWKDVTAYKIDGGEATEPWWYYDMIGILAQLGVIPENPSAQSSPYRPSRDSPSTSSTAG